MAEQPCRWCGQLHGVRCPIVKAMEFDSASGMICTRVEFVTDADAPPAQLPWPFNHPDRQMR